MAHHLTHKRISHKITHTPSNSLVPLLDHKHQNLPGAKYTPMLKRINGIAILTFQNIYAYV